MCVPAACSVGQVQVWAELAENLTGVAVCQMSRAKEVQASSKGLCREGCNSGPWSQNWVKEKRMRIRSGLQTCHSQLDQELSTRRKEWEREEVIDKEWEA